jgi:hypothetical protein
VRSIHKYCELGNGMNWLTNKGAQNNYWCFAFNAYKECLNFISYLVVFLINKKMERVKIKSTQGHLEGSYVIFWMLYIAYSSRSPGSTPWLSNILNRLIFLRVLLFSLLPFHPSLFLSCSKSPTVQHIQSPRSLFYSWPKTWKDSESNTDTSCFKSSKNVYIFMSVVWIHCCDLLWCEAITWV